MKNRPQKLPILEYSPSEYSSYQQTHEPENVNIFEIINQTIQSSQSHTTLHSKIIDDILHAINGFFYIKDQNCGVLISSGRQGIGKSAALLSGLSKSGYAVIMLKADGPECALIFQEILGRQILKISGCKKLSGEQFKNRISSNNNYKKHVLLVDNIEKLIKKNHSKQLYQFISIFTSKNPNIFLIGLTTQLNFASNLQNSNQYSFVKFKHFIFSQITIQSCKEIIEKILFSINQKLEKINQNNSRIIKFAFNKLSLSYFIEKTFEISQGNIRIIQKCIRQLLLSYDLTKYEIYPVEVDKIKEIFNQKNGTLRLEGLQLRNQMGLIAIFCYMRRTQYLTIGLNQFKGQLDWVEKSASLSESNLFSDILRDLQLYGLIAFRSQRQILLKTNLKDIEEAFKNHPIFNKFIQL